MIYNIYILYILYIHDLYILYIHDLQYEILLKLNHLQELFFINIFPLDILNFERNQ